MEQKIETKRDLRDYLNQLEFHASFLEMKAEEIKGHVDEVMGPYVAGERGEALKNYYAPIIQNVNNAYQNRQFATNFPDALRSLKIALYWD